MKNLVTGKIITILLCKQTNFPYIQQSNFDLFCLRKHAIEGLHQKTKKYHLYYSRFIVLLWSPSIKTNPFTDQK